MKRSKQPDKTLARSVGAASLSADDRKLLAEALRRGEETRNVMEDALVGFGRWILVTVFDDDATAALEARRENAVWSELLARAGGPTLRLSDKMLYLALHIAARDKRINDEAWRGLEPGRKALLLPLGDEASMREGAQHVTAMKLSQRATRQYVTATLEERGDAREVRVTAPRVTAALRRFRQRVTDKAVERKTIAALKSADAAETAEALKELEALSAWATRVLRRVRPE